MENETRTVRIKTVQVEGPIVGVIKRIDELTCVAAFNRGLFRVDNVAVIESLDEENCYRFTPLENFGGGIPHGVHEV